MATTSETAIEAADYLEYGKNAPMFGGERDGRRAARDAMLDRYAKAIRDLVGENADLLEACKLRVPSCGSLQGRMASETRKEAFDDLLRRAALIAKMDPEKDPSGIRYLGLIISEAMDYSAESVAELEAAIREAIEAVERFAKDPMASEMSGEVDTAEGRRLLERWRDYTLAYANDAQDVTLEDWEEVTKEAEDWAVENGLALLSRVAELEARVRELEAAIGRCCACRFDGDRQYEECHLHECQRSVCENGDPTDVTLAARVAELEAVLREVDDASYADDHGNTYVSDEAVFGKVRAALSGGGDQ